MVYPHEIGGTIANAEKRRIWSHFTESVFWPQRNTYANSVTIFIVIDVKSAAV
jgi:hypothetical protein